MEINGEKLALPIKKKIKRDVLRLKNRGVIPKIAIVTLGGDESWKTYVRRKLKFAKECGIEEELISLKREGELFSAVNKLNLDPGIHGIIVQRPIPASIDRGKLNSLISPIKDIDGFRRDSKHEAPVFQAVKNILIFIIKKRSSKLGLSDFLKTKKVAVIGKGESGGKPIIDGFEKLEIKPIVIDSKTKNISETLKKADIAISAVGRKIIKASNLKQDVVLIGVGTHRSVNKKLTGDYDEDEVKHVASYYTPTPGGVGPLNLSYLFKNLIDACKLQTRLER